MTDDITFLVRSSKEWRGGNCRQSLQLSTSIADAAGNTYTVGEDGNVTKKAGGSATSPVVATVSSDEDAFMQEIIQFYLDEITTYLTANPQYDKGPYYSDEVVKVLEDLPSCLQTRADDIAYIKRYLKHLQNDQNDRSYFVNLIRKSVAAFGENLLKAIEARSKPENKNKKLRDLLSVEDWKLVTNGMCEYLVIPAQEYHITMSVEKTFKTEGDCFTRALKRGMEVKTSFDMAAYAALIEAGLCLTEKGNCAGTEYWSQFSCGVANGLVQELDVVAMGEGVATLLITQVKNRYSCIADGNLIDVVVQEPTMEQAVHAYSKCVLGFDMTLDEWKKLYSTVEKYVATNWQDPYLHGQATVFVASLVIPVTKLSKVKLLGKLKINPNFANKVDDLAKLSEAAGDSKKLEKLADELTIVTEAGELLYAKLGVRKTINLTTFTAKGSDDFIDVVVHFSNGKFKAIVEESGSFIEKSIEIEQLGKTLNQIPGNRAIRVLSCNDIATAQKLSKQIPAKTLYASDGWVDLYADGAIQSQNKFQKIVNGETLLPEVAMDGSAGSGVKSIRLGEEVLTSSAGRRTLKAKDASQIGIAGSTIKIELIDEAGNLVGELKRVPSVGKEFNYYFTDYNGANGVTKNKQYVLQSKSTIITSTSPGGYSIPNEQNILYMDFNLPKNISDNYSGLGKMMFDDAFTYYNRSNRIDGIYGEWIKSVDLYKDYDGMSINLKKFQDAYTSGLSKEQAAFKTITGEWALSKEFSKVNFKVFDLKQGRIEVIFNK